MSRFLGNLCKCAVLSAVLSAGPAAAFAQTALNDSTVVSLTVTPAGADSVAVHLTQPAPLGPDVSAGLHSAGLETIYALPYSRDLSRPDWHRLWINTAILSGAFVGTLLVLECLPENATTWNRRELQSVPLFKRLNRHVLHQGPEWDHDRMVFNYILHPYAGAVYFMAARSCGFNFWQSWLYCTLISDVGWEFGVEAFMERPSMQDIILTPLTGALFGEAFYCLKRHIVSNGYTLFGSAVLGNVIAFIIDPVNELVGFFDHNPARAYARRIHSGGSVDLSPVVTRSFRGFALTATF